MLASPSLAAARRLPATVWRRALSAYGNVVGGRVVPATATYDVLNPSTGEVLAQAPRSSAAEVDAAVAAARAAFDPWSALPLATRQQHLVAAAAEVEDSIPALAALLSQEQGKPLWGATSELRAVANWLGWWGTMKIPFEEVVVKETEAETVLQVRLHPPPRAPVA